MSVLWFDLTASYGWRRPPSGIVRVEQECLRQALEMHQDRVRYCVYDVAMHCWYEMPATVVAALVQAAGSSSQAEALRDWRPASSPVRFAPGDGYLCLSADQTLERFQALYQARRRVGLRVYGMVYDLIPILFPHFYWNQADQSCARFMADLVAVSDHLFCISQSTRQDLLGFCEAIGVVPPPSSIVRLGDELRTAQDDCSPEVVALCQRDFILVVGTVEIRKNHEVLYRAWLDLLERGVEDLPLLVFAGMPGWRVDDLMLSLQLDPRVQGRIVHLPQATDSDLRELYRHCLATAFPSQYEGWGLPVAESLAYGKVCLVARNSAMTEIAGEELLVFVDTFDVRGWAQALMGVATDAKWRTEREQAIRTKYEVTPWSQPARQIVEGALAHLAGE